MRISTQGEGLGRPRCTAARGCPDTSPRRQSQTLVLRSRPLSALGSQGNPRRNTWMLASNSRAPRSKDAWCPCLICYCALPLLSLSVFIPLVQLEYHVKSLVNVKIVGGGGEWGSSQNVPSRLLISHKHLYLTDAKRMLRARDKTPFNWESLSHLLPAELPSTILPNIPVTSCHQPLNGKL